MSTCDLVRALLALDPDSSDSLAADHVVECPMCAAYRLRTQALDAVLRPEMRWEAPAELTNRLLLIAASPWTPVPPLMRARPQRWYVTLVYVLTLVVLALSLALAWQFALGISSQFGLFDGINELLAVPGWAMQQLTVARPESRYAIDLLLRARDQLMWLLLAAVLWVALERWNPQLGFGRRQVS
jgi:hypothetical protein